MTKVREIWKDIPGFTGKYQASNLGRIKSLDRVVNSLHGPNTKKTKGKILKFGTGTFGYLSVDVGHTKSVHRLVAITFITNLNPKTKLYVNHKNGIKTDNRVQNLEWVTASENNKHAIKNGLWDCFGVKCYNAKFSKQDVILIRESYKNGEQQKTIAKKYSCHPSAISAIVNYRNWKHI